METHYKKELKNQEYAKLLYISKQSEHLFSPLYGQNACASVWATDTSNHRFLQISVHPNNIYSTFPMHWAHRRNKT